MCPISFTRLYVLFVTLLLLGLQIQPCELIRNILKKHFRKIKKYAVTNNQNQIHFLTLSSNLPNVKLIYMIAITMITISKSQLHNLIEILSMQFLRTIPKTFEDCKIN